MSLIRDLVQRVRTLIGVGVQLGSRYRDDVLILQSSPRADGDPLEARYISPFGLAGHPPKGSKNVIASMGGNRSQTIIIFAYDEKYTLVLDEGEAGLYNEWGDFIKLNSAREIHAKADARIVLDAPETVIKQALIVEGDVQFVGAMTHDNKTIDSSHTHTLPDNSETEDVT